MENLFPTLKITSEFIGIGLVVVMVIIFAIHRFAHFVARRML